MIGMVVVSRVNAGLPFTETLERVVGVVADIESFAFLNSIRNNTPF